MRSYTSNLTLTLIRLANIEMLTLSQLTSPTVLIKRQFETYTSLEEPYETTPVPHNAGNVPHFSEEYFLVAHNNNINVNTVPCSVLMQLQIKTQMRG